MPISCNIHDYIEIACLFKLDVLVSLKNGDVKQGFANTTEIAQNGPIRDECLVLSASSSSFISVVLTNISEISSASENPHFKIIDFEKGTVIHW